MALEGWKLRLTSDMKKILFGQPKSDIWLTHADGGGGGCQKKLIQNYTLDERKNEENGSNNEINQSDILLILFSQGLKNVNFPTSWKILLCV